MLLDDDVVTNGQTESSSLTGGLSREKRIEDVFLHLSRNAGAADRYLDTVAEVLSRGSQGRFIIAPIGFDLTLCRGVEAVRDQVEQRPRNLCGNRSTSPAAGSKDLSRVILK